MEGSADGWWVNFTWFRGGGRMSVVCIANMEIWLSCVLSSKSCPCQYLTHLYVVCCLFI